MSNTITTYEALRIVYLLMGQYNDICQEKVSLGNISGTDNKATIIVEKGSPVFGGTNRHSITRNWFAKRVRVRRQLPPLSAQAQYG